MLRFVAPSQHQSVDIIKFNKAANDNLMASALTLDQGESGLISGAVLGRIKGTGISFRGIEYQAMVTTPQEVIIVGKDGAIRWQKALQGLKVGNQALDAVRLTAADGDSVNFVVGTPNRPRVIKHLRAAAGLASGIFAGTAALMTTPNGVFGLPGNSESHQRLSPDQIRDLIEEAGDVFMEDEETEEGGYEDVYDDGGDSYDDGGDFG